ncbi:uncharacterized protein N7498_005883 [Penicillium cinerascens]|uniref:MJ1316 RNA cyclic group end recognition domain-containing protein n=1 Tax=Penicillium cinerascens TaxID=70096 RepID=A0A9W9MPA2_9EURO|nr:uncharacterized protein N7498_005883 [Penicillium cinerascens]KAJ5205004.1 hypothetical protein N7498_005883 [Penicillium cinerascens]
MAAEASPNESMVSKMNNELEGNPSKSPSPTIKVKPKHVKHVKHVRRSPSPPDPRAGKNKLRPAADIINRITWDEEFKRTDFIIGFVDRFEGQLEINMENWKKESTDEEFIPQHRIIYIKHVDGEVVWDRRRRIDKVFTSGNSAFSELAFLM